VFPGEARYGKSYREVRIGLDKKGWTTAVQRDITLAILTCDEADWQSL